jgi:hypothetical protein
MKRKNLHVRTAITTVAGRIIIMALGGGPRPLDQSSYIDQTMKIYLSYGESPLGIHHPDIAVFPNSNIPFPFVTV